MPCAAVFGKVQHSPDSTVTVSLFLSPIATFSSSKINSHLKKNKISRRQRNPNKCDEAATRYPKKEFQECSHQWKRRWIKRGFRRGLLQSDFSPEEELKNMDENDIEELENERGEKVDLVKWQDTRNLTRPALLENTLIAIVWNKLVSFRELSKFGKEHKLLELLITATREEIESKGTFSCLVTVILEENLRKKKFENIMRHTTETGKRIYELSRQSLQIARERRQNWETHNEIVGILKISQKKLKYKAYLKLTREKKLTNAYVEQELKDISMTYDDIVVDLENSEEATKTEEMVTKTICTFLNKRHAQLEEMLEYWMERYERQIDEAQRRLDDLRNKRSQQWDQTFCILQLYTSYSQIVDESKREELEMEKRSTREKRLLDASVRIQTWWRFIMVRKQLGPFRVKRKGKGKGKKGKKK